VARLVQASQHAGSVGGRLERAATDKERGIEHAIVDARLRHQRHKAAVQPTIGHHASEQVHVNRRLVVQPHAGWRAAQPADQRQARQRVGELVSAGVVLSSGGDDGSGGPTFVFTGLNKLKPQMIAEATARARESAEQFAKDSHSDIGGIRSASQGVFEILPRDQAQGISEASQIVKTVRVVSTIDYSLKN